MKSNQISSPPIEYIHRHRLMKQVVNCLLDRNTGPKDTDDVTPFANDFTCITSRHSVKAGNGKAVNPFRWIEGLYSKERQDFYATNLIWQQDQY